MGRNLLLALGVLISLCVAEQARGDSAGSSLTLPVSLSVFPPVQILPAEHLTVDGLALNIGYESPDVVNGVDVGIVSRVRERMTGIQIQAGVSLGAEVDGLAVCGLLCKSTSGIAMTVSPFATLVGNGGGLQAGLYNHAESYVGIQVGGWNAALFKFWGIQIGFANMNNTEMTKAPEFRIDNIPVSDNHGHWTNNYVSTQTEPGQSVFYAGTNVGLFVGVFNLSDDTTGVQIGAANFATELHGVQVGVINVVRRLYGVQLGVINFAISNALPFLPVMLIGW